MENNLSKNIIYSGVIIFLLINITLINAQLSFTETTQNFGTGTINDIEFGDINADGFQDAIIAKGEYNVSQNNELWINDGKGNFVLTDQNLGSDGMDIGIADLDIDGDLDLFIAKGKWSNTLASEVYLNDGLGNFTNSNQSIAVDKNTGSVFLADFDGDNDIDAFLANSVTQGSTLSGNEVWLNDGNGNFTNSDQELGSGIDHYRVKGGDIDNDDDIDVITSSNAQSIDENENEIWINNGMANFTKKVLSKEYSNDLALGDIDDDDDLDILITHFGREVSDFIGAKIYLNDGSGNFIISQQNFDSVQCTGIALGDLDRDGDLDIVFANGDWDSDAPNRIWLNNSLGNFTKNDYNFKTDDGIALVKLCDINNDEDLDIIFTGSIWKNDLISSITSDLNNTNFRVFPNPAKISIQIKSNSLSEIAGYKIIDSSGRIIKQDKLKSDIIDISELDKGIFLLILQTKKGLMNRKIMIE